MHILPICIAVGCSILLWVAGQFTSSLIYGSKIKSIQAVASKQVFTPHFIMQIGVSIFVLCFAGAIIWSRRFDQSDQKWAYGIIGNTMGFWYRGKG